jgi:hypothetical protein
VLEAEQVVEMIEREGVPPGLVLSDKFARTWDQSFDRLARLEQRLDYQIQRCTRELRQLRKDAEKTKALPSSPFLETVRPEQEEEKEDEGETPSPREETPTSERETSNTQNEPTAEADGVNAGAASGNGEALLPVGAAPRPPGAGSGTA